MIEKTRDLVPQSYAIKGWINGQLYAQSKHVSGVSPVPEVIRSKAAMNPALPGDRQKKLHWYLALRQGTQYAVMAVHTTEEKMLFSKLMKTNLSFNRNNQHPDWKEAVKIWNRDHVNGEKIFYKVCVIFSFYKNICF